MCEQHSVLRIDVLEYGEVVARHRCRGDSVGSDRGMPVPALVEGDHTVAALQQQVPQDGPLDDAHVDAVGQDDGRPCAGGDHADSGAVGALHKGCLALRLLADPLIGVGVG